MDRPTERTSDFEAITDGHAGDEGIAEDFRVAGGRVPGRRGLATRRRLLDKTKILLNTTTYRDLKVVDIAREADMSPGTFYQYFQDAPDAVLALAKELVEEGGERLVEPLLEANWRGSGSLEACDEIARAFLEFWADHAGVMTVIDLAGLEGDVRFRECRTELLNRFTTAATTVIDKQRSAGFAPQDLDPEATAVVLVSMLSHVAAHQRGIRRSGVEDQDLRRSMARLIYAGVIGRTPLD